MPKGWGGVNRKQLPDAKGVGRCQYKAVTRCQKVREVSTESSYQLTGTQDGVNRKQLPADREAGWCQQKAVTS